MAKKTIFNIKDVRGKTLRLTDNRHEHIVERPEMLNQDDRIKETLKSPDEIKESSHAKDVLLYYRLYGKTPVTKKYMLVVAKIDDGKGFVITALYTDKIKKGVTKWKK